MDIHKTKKILSRILQEFKSQKFQIGFVPTMGALHKGHISLVNQSKSDNDITVVSIFVNPTQFNDKNDLTNYPRSIEQDLSMLQQAGCDLVFTPSVDEMYPPSENDKHIFNFGILDQVMEGLHRPGHFNGVAQIVSKLFDSITPDRAYFGEKDFQQLAIIRNMTRQMNYAVNIVGCPIVREEDGLAMSSRNMLLSSTQRQNAPAIFKILSASKTLINSMPLPELKKWVTEQINSIPELQTEYFEIVDRDSFQPLSHLTDKLLMQGCIAVKAGTIRLIDNIAY